MGGPVGIIRGGFGQQGRFIVEFPEGHGLQLRKKKGDHAANTVSMGSADDDDIVEPTPEPEGLQDSEPEPESWSGPGPEPEAEPEVEPEAESEVEPEAEPEVEPEAWVAAELSCPAGNWDFGSDATYKIEATHALAEVTTTIGRSSKTNDADAPDVQLNSDKKVSRQHALIRHNVARHRFFLRVLAKKGTSVNGAPH
eukprot:SAG11_NODE_1028_length_6123_cov_1.537517_4_plen_197_part_00